MLKSISVPLFGAIVFSMLATVQLSAAPALTARSNNAAGASVVVTPKSLAPGAKIWEFNVVMNTHISPLNENLAQVAVLVDDAGHRYKPAAWQGDPPGGHHRKGVLQFSPPAESPKSIELQISGIGGVAVRSFRWELK